MAVPTTVKMPEPITAPMPSAVSESGPRVFRKPTVGVFRVGNQLVDGLFGKELGGCQKVAPG